MTDHDLIRNCVMQYRRPFDAALIAGLTGVCIKVVQHALTDLEATGQIKCISSTESIYVRVNRYSRPSSPDDLPWPVYPEKAIPLLDLIERQPFSNGRKMAEVLGMSHQWVYVYLKALASTGVVRRMWGRYKVLNRKRLGGLGMESRKGVLRTKSVAHHIQRKCKMKRSAKIEGNRQPSITYQPPVPSALCPCGAGQSPGRSMRDRFIRERSGSGGDSIAQAEANVVVAIGNPVNI